MRIVVDTNVIISALGWNGYPREIMTKVLDLEIEVIISERQIAELERVMKYRKFTFSNEEINKLMFILRLISFPAETKTELNVLQDKSDNMLLEAAVESNANYIITGDRAILNLKEFRSVKIVSPADFIKKNLYSSTV